MKDKSRNLTCCFLLQSAFVKISVKVPFRRHPQQNASTLCKQKPCNGAINNRSSNDLFLIAPSHDFCLHNADLCLYFSFNTGSSKNVSWKFHGLCANSLVLLPIGYYFSRFYNGSRNYVCE